MISVSKQIHSLTKVAPRSNPTLRLPWHPLRTSSWNHQCTKKINPSSRIHLKSNSRSHLPLLLQTNFLKLKVNTILNHPHRERRYQNWCLLLQDAVLETPSLNYSFTYFTSGNKKCGVGVNGNFWLRTNFWLTVIFGPETSPIRKIMKKLWSLYFSKIIIFFFSTMKNL